MIALGGGAVTIARDARARSRDAFTVLLDVDVDTAWERVRGSDRPLAQDEGEFRRLYDERQPLYREVADAVVASGDVDGVVLAAGGRPPRARRARPARRARARATARSRSSPTAT